MGFLVRLAGVLLLVLAGIVGGISPASAYWYNGVWIEPAPVVPYPYYRPPPPQYYYPRPPPRRVWVNPYWDGRRWVPGYWRYY